MNRNNRPSWVFLEVGLVVFSIFCVLPIELQAPAGTVEPCMVIPAPCTLHHSWLQKDWMPGDLVALNSRRWVTFLH